jgi:hypothetical protein
MYRRPRGSLRLVTARALFLAAVAAIPASMSAEVSQLRLPARARVRQIPGKLLRQLIIKMTDVKADLDNPPAILLTTTAAVPAVIAARGQHAGRRFVEFFTANIRNPNTRKAYCRATCEFFDWCDQAGLGLLDIEPVHVKPGSKASATVFPRPPSSNGWPRSACCSTGSCSARSSPSIPPPRFAAPNTSSGPARPGSGGARSTPVARQHQH